MGYSFALAQLHRNAASLVESSSVQMVKLIPYQSAFLESFLEWRGQPSSVRHNPLKPMSRAKIARMLESEGADISDLKKHESYRWFVECDGIVVGNVSLKNVSLMMNYAEIGYGIGEPYHCQGIATAAVQLLVQMAFSQSSLRKLLAYVHEKNVASCRVLQKLWFHAGRAAP